MCSDSIQFRAIGAITQPLMEWVNRPTFQQADEIQGHGPVSVRRNALSAGDLAHVRARLYSCAHAAR